VFVDCIVLKTDYYTYIPLTIDPRRDSTVAETSLIFLQETHIYQKYLAMRNIADATGGKPIAFRSQSISGFSAVNPFATSMEERECYSFNLSRTPQETLLVKNALIEKIKNRNRIEIMAPH
jgi:hypothetical protein